MKNIHLISLSSSPFPCERHINKNMRPQRLPQLLRGLPHNLFDWSPSSSVHRYRLTHFKSPPEARHQEKILRNPPIRLLGWGKVRWYILRYTDLSSSTAQARRCICGDLMKDRSLVYIKLHGGNTHVLPYEPSI